MLAASCSLGEQGVDGNVVKIFFRHPDCKYYEAFFFNISIWSHNALSEFHCKKKLLVLCRCLIFSVTVLLREDFIKSDMTNFWPVDSRCLKWAVLAIVYCCKYWITFHPVIVGYYFVSWHCQVIFKFRQHIWVMMGEWWLYWGRYLLHDQRGWTTLPSFSFCHGSSNWIHTELWLYFAAVSVWVGWATRQPFPDPLCIPICFILPAVSYLWPGTVSYIMESHHSHSVL
jgi:hypothetical protein